MPNLSRASRLPGACRAGALLLPTLVLSLSIAWAQLPPGFIEQEIAGFAKTSRPVAFTFLPDGRLLLLQRPGRILLVDPRVHPAPRAPYLTLENLDHEGERGLLAVALDPGFPARPYVYLYYTPHTPGRARIARFTHRGETADPASEIVLWEDTEGYTNDVHYGGGLDFGPDGRLYLSIGDKGNARRAQDLTQAGGKIIRINVDGSVPADNPFFDGPGPNHDAIWAYGLRNPFRAGWDLPTGRFFVGEVGGNVQEKSWEDVHLGRAGANYGWPACEGYPGNPAFPDCDPARFDAPVFAYPHAGENASLTGGVVYRGSGFPAGYQGAYFYGDYARGWIRYLTFDSSGRIVTGDHPFRTGAGGVVALEEGPDGALYYIRYQGSLRRIVYEGGNRAPVITQAAAGVTAGPGPRLRVRFTGEATDDGAGPLAYRWHFGDGAAAEGSRAAHTYRGRGLYQAYLEVSDGEQTGRSEPISITVGLPPVAIITAPPDGARFRAGDAIRLSGIAEPGNGGPLTDEHFGWTVDFLHEGHLHPVTGSLPGPNGVFEVPTSGHEYAGHTRYRITLAVTDADGLSDTATVVIWPEKVRLAFETRPAGFPVALDGIPGVTPFAREELIGFRFTMGVPASGCLDGTRYGFAGWSDGGALEHEITVPAAEAGFTATFEPEGPCETGVVPLLACVHDRGDGFYTALFGYDNPTGARQAVRVGPENGFSPGPVSRGQPGTFPAGAEAGAFAVLFDGHPITWRLTTGGRTRTVTASRLSAACATDPVLPLVPLPACVEPEEAGTYRAHFGYENPNAMRVYVPAGTALNRFAPGPGKRGQGQLFRTGRQENRFTFRWDGSPLTWHLTGNAATADAASSGCPARVQEAGADELFAEEEGGYEEAVPADHGLEGAYPNPFNPSTRVRFRIAAPGRVRLDIYDVLGRRVATLVDRDLEAGVHEAGWDGRGPTGLPVSGGVYVVRLQAGRHAGSIRVSLLR